MVNILQPQASYIQCNIMFFTCDTTIKTNYDKYTLFMEIEAAT